MRQVKDLWEDLRRNVLPKDIGGTQLIESRRCFYAGASAFFVLLNEAAVDGELDSQGADKLDHLYKEIECFFEEEVETGFGLPNASPTPGPGKVCGECGESGESIHKAAGIKFHNPCPRCKGSGLEGE